MKYIVGIDLGIYDSSVCVVMKYDGEHLHIIKQKELRQDEQTRLLSIYYSNPPKQKENFNLGGGVDVVREFDYKTYERIMKQWGEELLR